MSRTPCSTDTNAALTVTGGSVITITENNGGHFNGGGITVTGDSGTTSVSVTQTENDVNDSNNGVVTITDVNGASTTAAGTITNVWLDGLSGNGAQCYHRQCVDHPNHQPY